MDQNLRDTFSGLFMLLLFEVLNLHSAYVSHVCTTTRLCVSQPTPTASLLLLGCLCTHHFPRQSLYFLPRDGVHVTSGFKVKPPGNTPRPAAIVR